MQAYTFIALDSPVSGLPRPVAIARRAIARGNVNARPSWPRRGLAHALAAVIVSRAARRAVDAVALDDCSDRRPRCSITHDLEVVVCATGSRDESTASRSSMRRRPDVSFSVDDGASARPPSRFRRDLESGPRTPPSRRLDAVAADRDGLGRRRSSRSSPCSTTPPCGEQSGIGTSWLPWESGSGASQPGSSRRPRRPGAGRSTCGSPRAMVGTIRPPRCGAGSPLSPTRCRR